MSPIKLHKPLKAENFFQLSQKKKEKEKKRKKRFEAWEELNPLVALKMEKWGHKWRIWLASRSWECSPADRQQENRNLSSITEMK